MLREGQEGGDDTVAGAPAPPTPPASAGLDENDAVVLRRRLSEMEDRLQAAELQLSAQAQIDSDARAKANEMTAEKTREIRSLRRTRLAATCVSIAVIMAVSANFWYSIVHDPTILKERITDPWAKLAFVTGHLVLLGVLVTIMLRSLYTPTAKDESPNVLVELIKALTGSMKGGG